MSAYKARVHNIFDRLRREEMLVLSPSEHRALKDLICVGPSLMSKSFTQDVINRSFVLAGMIDENMSSFPDGDKLMATIRRLITVEEHKLVLSSEVQNIKHVLEEGVVGEDKYNHFGYPVDMDIFGNEYLCNAGITNESGQRSKHLSSKLQREMRCKNIEKQGLLY
jgi:hypothetical protein